MIDQTASVVCSWFFPSTCLHNRSLSLLRCPIIVLPVLVLPRRFCFNHCSPWFKLTLFHTFPRWAMMKSVQFHLLLWLHLLSLLDPITLPLINLPLVSMSYSIEGSSREKIGTQPCRSISESQISCAIRCLRWLKWLVDHRQSLSELTSNKRNSPPVWKQTGA